MIGLGVLCCFCFAFVCVGGNLGVFLVHCVSLSSIALLYCLSFLMIVNIQKNNKKKKREEEEEEEEEKENDFYGVKLLSCLIICFMISTL